MPSLCPLWVRRKGQSCGGFMSSRRTSSSALVSSSRPLRSIWHVARPPAFPLPFLYPSFFPLSFSSSLPPCLPPPLPVCFPLSLLVFHPTAGVEHTLSDLRLRSQISLGLNPCFAIYYVCKLGQIAQPKSHLLDRVRTNTYLLGSLGRKNVNTGSTLCRHMDST